MSSDRCSSSLCDMKLQQTFFTGPAQIFSSRCFPGRPKTLKALAEASWQEVLCLAAAPVLVRTCTEGLRCAGIFTRPQHVTSQPAMANSSRFCLLHQREQVPHAVLIRTRSLLQLAGVLVFSATPFVVVKAIANSAVGESLQRRLKVRKEEDAKQAAAAKSAQEEAKQER